MRNNTGENLSLHLFYACITVHVGYIPLVDTPSTTSTHSVFLVKICFGIVFLNLAN